MQGIVQDILLSNTKMNLKKVAREQCNVIITKSGLVAEGEEEKKTKREYLKRDTCWKKI